MIDLLVAFALGSATAYALATKERRTKVMAKLNDWTKPKQEP